MAALPGWQPERRRRVWVEAGRRRDGENACGAAPRSAYIRRRRDRVDPERLGGASARGGVAPAPGAGISMGAWEAGLRVRRQSERQQSGPSGYAVGRKVIGDKNNSFWAETLFKLEFLYSRSTLSVQQLDDGWVWREA
jgi:hypothetical protein